MSKSPSQSQIQSGKAEGRKSRSGPAWIETRCLRAQASWASNSSKRSWPSVEASDFQGQEIRAALKRLGKSAAQGAFLGSPRRAAEQAGKLGTGGQPGLEHLSGVDVGQEIADFPDRGQARLRGVERRLRLLARRWPP